MESKISVRAAKPSDATSLKELAAKSFVNAYGQHNTPEDMANYLAKHFNQENVLAELSDSENLFLLAMKSNEIVGYAKLQFKTSYEVAAKRPIEIARLYTRVELIGSGIGKILIQEIENYSKENGFDAICLGVWQKNTGAVRFYEREGFVLVGNTTFILGTDVQDDFVMLKKVK